MSAETPTVAAPVLHCVDCKHFLLSSTSPEFSRCAVANLTDLASDHMNWLVTGIGDTPPRTNPYCSTSRSILGTCGADGKLFERK